MSEQQGNGNGSIIQRGESQIVGTSRPAVGELAKALAKAQGAIRRVDHDARNTFHGYAYTSAEAVIEASKDPLGAAGLALLPLEQTLNGHEKEGVDRFELECKFLLIHSSGESLPLIRHWPVCPDKGRPLDKATASASTTALAYLLRDLLLIPRVDPQDDAAGREDRPAQQQRPTSAKKAGPALPKDGAELQDRLEAYGKRLHTQGLCPTADALYEFVLGAGIQAGYVEDMTKWPAPAVSLAVEKTKEFEAKARKQEPVAAGK